MIAVPAYYLKRILGIDLLFSESFGKKHIYKNFSLTKLQAGADGDSPTIYSVMPNTFVIKQDFSGVYSHENATFTAYSKTGNEDQVEYAGRFEIFINGSTTYSYQSGENESSCTFSLKDKGSIKSICCVLYPAGGNSETVLDTQTIVVVNDGDKGDKGDQGDKGDAAINVILGNQADIIPCDNDGKVKSEMTLSIPFTGYVGINKEECTVSVTGLTSGIAIKSNVAGTTSKGGTLELKVSEGSDLGGADSGSITLTFTCKGSEIVHYYQWSKSIQSENAVLFEIYAPMGNIIYNGGNSVTLNARLMNGSSVVTDTLMYTWYKYDKGEYKKINNVTTNTLSVGPTDVSGYASYKCEVTYAGDTRTAYYAVMDKSDPIQAQVYCSLGTQILNGQGYGAVYTKIYRNGEEIDAIKSETFSTTAPANGDFYYKLDPNNNAVALMKRSGNDWITATGDDLPKAAYKYTFRNKDGCNHQSVYQ